MPFLTLILSFPLILVANAKKQDMEPFISLKLLGIWLLSLMYITVNDNFRIHFGIICAILIVFKAKSNRKSKLIALTIGIISLSFSSLIYLLHDL